MFFLKLLLEMSQLKLLAPVSHPLMLSPSAANINSHTKKYLDVYMVNRKGNYKTAKLSEKGHNIDSPSKTAVLNSGLCSAS
jgi:hypothetical protein